MAVPVIGFGRRLERPTPALASAPTLPVIDMAGAREADAANGSLTPEDERDLEASLATAWGTQGEMERRDREEASWNEGIGGSMLVIVLGLVALSGAGMGIAGWLLWTLIRSGHF